MMRGKERKITCLWRLSIFKFLLLAQISFPHFGCAKFGASKGVPSSHQLIALALIFVRPKMRERLLGRLYYGFIETLLSLGAFV